MYKMVIMRGLPGSGKSTLANSLEGACILSTDDIFMDRNDSVYLWNIKQLGAAHQINIQKCEMALTKKQVLIVIDNTNTTYKEIRPYAELAKAHGYEIEIREPSTNWAKCPESCHELTTHGVPLPVIEKMSERWESTESIMEKINER